MSAEGAAHAAFVAALAGVAGLNRVEPGASVRATPPYAEVGALVASDWGTKDRVGREVRVTVLIRDLAERAERLHALSEACAAALERMPRDLPDASPGTGAGWRIASLVPVRSRTASERGGLWAAAQEWRVRVLAD